MYWRGPGIIVSIVFIGAIVLSFIFPYKPRFVIPHTIRQRTITYIIVSLLALIPLDLRIANDSGYSTRQIIPVQILFDVSLSMTANDLIPSRFSVAKNMVHDLILSWDGSPLSIILFSGMPFVHIPFSTDTEAILAKWQTTRLGQFPPVPQFVGTAIGDALLLGAQNLERNNFGSGVIIMITDGDSNKGYEPDDVISILEKKNIPLFAIGVGKTDAFTVGYDIFNNPIYTTYNPLFLTHLTEKVGGKTFVAQTIEDIQSIMISLDNEIQKKSYPIDRQTYFSLNNIFIPIVFMRILSITGLRIRIRYTNK